MYIGVGVYVMDSIGAVATYEEAFGLELGYHVCNENGTFFHSELNKDGNPVICVVQGDKEPGINPVQLGYQFDSKEELEKAFALLSKEGTILMEICELPWSPCAAEVVDRFGIRWYLTVPQHRPADDFTPADMEDK